MTLLLNTLYVDPDRVIGKAARWAILMTIMNKPPWSVICITGNEENTILLLYLTAYRGLIIADDNNEEENNRVLCCCGWRLLSSLQVIIKEKKKRTPVSFAVLSDGIPGDIIDDTMWLRTVCCTIEAQGLTLHNKEYFYYRPLLRTASCVVVAFVHFPIHHSRPRTRRDVF